MLILTACSPCPTVPADLVATTRIAVADDPGAALGTFDPSFADGVMSYSAVTEPFGTERLVSTRIAVSDGDGWRYVASVNDNAGGLNHEVTSIVRDGETWRLFAHSYHVYEDRNDYADGHIAEWTAPAPEGPWTWAGVALGWPSASSFSSDGARALTTDLGLGDCVALTEPGALVRDGVLDLAVGCATGSSLRVELLRDWTRVGPLLGDGYNAASLFEVDGVEYVVASPSDAAGYRGCHVAEVGETCPFRLMDVADGAFAGACAWEPGRGYVMSVLGDGFAFHRTGVGTP